LLITADNSRFASCGGDKSLFVWDVKQGKVITKIQAHDFKINTIDWNLENSVIASGSDDSTVKFWDLKAVTYRPIQTVRDFKDSISKIMIKEHKVYISSLDNNLRIYDLRMGDMTTDFMNGPILSFDVSNDQKLYATVN
jgi:mitogen-activated protein kinase organizer 1